MGKNSATSSAGTTTLYVKNMVCSRCIRVVREELEHMGIDVRSVQLGEVAVDAHGLEKKLGRVKQVLTANGFELIDDSKARIVERIKSIIIGLIHESSGERSDLRYSQRLARTLGHDYRNLSKLFSSVESVTIEHFFILQRIERVKELLVYGELTLSEIAYQLGFSSVHHLSNQFKQVTGFTPTRFKRDKPAKRLPIDHVV